MRYYPVICLLSLFWGATSDHAVAQSVGLPAPRLLTMVPTGGQAGTQVDVEITGEFVDDTRELVFSHSGITAVPKLDAEGKPLANQFQIAIASEVPSGLYEARLMTRLGLSTSRVFSVGQMVEVVRRKPNNSLSEALPLNLNTLCNAATTPKSVDFYSFAARKGARIVMECAARGIESKLFPALILADAQGQDRLVERRQGYLDFVVPEDGTYIVKVHSLTYEGGPAHYYRLALQEIPIDAPAARLPSIPAVNSFSWPPTGLAELAQEAEQEPNDAAHVQAISLPCDLKGDFAQAADVDTFEFTAQQGDVWWAEVASERLGLPTDPTLLVQQVTEEGADTKLTDLIELTDIPSPIKPSSNGYSYDGPPYEAGSADLIGKIQIPATGRYRLTLKDLFGGTRNDPRNIYRLVIRQAQPDFALVAWGLHMELRNGDRCALSKPLTLRRGATLGLEVVAIRRDGFDGEIQLAMEELPEGVTASGLKIPAGKSRGMMLLTASESAPRGWRNARFFGTATIGGEPVTRPCRFASMSWPVADAWQEIPSPRLIFDVPVSVSDDEATPLMLLASEPKVWSAKVGETITIPLVHRRRSDFSGTTLQLKTAGDGFEHSSRFEVPIMADGSQAVLNLAELKTPPGDYTIAFYGSAVAKYRYNLAAVSAAEKSKQAAEERLRQRTAAAEEQSQLAASAASDLKESVAATAADAAEQVKMAKIALDEANKQLQAANDMAQPKDIVDIVWSQPIQIHVSPLESP